MDAPFEHVALIGVGLMGGSLGLALREAGLARELSGFSRRSETRARALRLGLVDRAPDRIEDAVDGADLVVLATPIGTYPSILQAVRPALRSDAIVTDLGSAKAEPIRAAEAILGHAAARFVGGHPMAGSEESGPEAARADLYRGAVWCLTPTARTDPKAEARVAGMARALGARVIRIDAGEHDRAAAAASHLPHVAAAVLVLAFGELSVNATAAAELAASGFRDTTRVVGGSPEMWVDICLGNRAALLEALRAYDEVLHKVRSAIDKDDAATLMDLFTDAQSHRARVVGRARRAEEKDGKPSK